MRIYSWNVNGVRAAVKKGFANTVYEDLSEPEIICLQETKAQDDQVLEALEGLKGYNVYSNSAVKKGYSGVAIVSRIPAMDVISGIGIEEHDQEGRVLTAEFEDFYLISVYTPNSQNGLKRLPYRKEWDKAFAEFVIVKEKNKPVIICGDLNVAHERIDIARPDSNYNKSAGFTQDEIDGLDHLLSKGYVDTFRHKYPEKVQYSWWSFRANARAKNIGWRIDYFLASTHILDRVTEAFIRDEVEGSDHCPIGIELS
ncbi:MAG: exodeoxyribonuclease III [Flavobacteriales bacterium]|nr:exodeoxyribonuclease III [Flavobacteriales bacterium]